MGDVSGLGVLRFAQDDGKNKNKNKNKDKDRGKGRCQCGGLSTAPRTMKLFAASVEMTFLLL
jgi:hypothetical protein